LLVVATIQAALAVVVAFTMTGSGTRLAAGHLRMDPTARLFLIVIDVIFLGIAGYVWGRSRAAPELRDTVARFAQLGLVFMAAANVSSSRTT